MAAIIRLGRIISLKETNTHGYYSGAAHSHSSEGSSVRHEPAC